MITFSAFGNVLDVKLEKLEQGLNVKASTRAQPLNKFNK